MGRKVFISILGTSFYRKSIYEKETPAFIARETRFIQLATLELLKADEWDRENSLIVIGLTEGARKTNWNLSTAEKPNQRVIPNPNKEVKEWEEYLGLEDELSARFPGIPVKECSIPDGKVEKEIMEIFSRLFSFIGKEDRLYFDLTHGFRYLPMLVTVLANYSRFIYPEVTIEHMSYGNFELKNKNGNCTFIDLMPLHALQDLTFAAGQYVESGSIKKLPDEDLYLPLKMVIADFHTCRGIEIIKGNHIKEAKDKIEEVLANCPKAVVPIIKTIERDLQDFSSTMNVKNGYQAALWCKRNDLIQQAITILDETVISNVLFAEGIGWDVKKNRDIVSNCFTLIHYKSKEYKFREKEGSEKRKQEEQLVDQMYNSPLLNNLVGLMVRIKSIRDDIDHAGMRDNAQASQDLKEKCEELFDKVKELNLC